MATEGGPGDPATEPRDDYLALFALLRKFRDVVPMDNRAPASRAPSIVLALQTAEKWTIELAAACGESWQLGGPLQHGLRGG